MPDPCLSRYHDICLEPAMLPVIDPDRLFAVVDHKLLKVSILEQDLYVSKPEVLPYYVAYQDICCCLVKICEIPAYENLDLLLELLPNEVHSLLGGNILHRDSYMGYELLPYPLKNHLCCRAYV